MNTIEEKLQKYVDDHLKLNKNRYKRARGNFKDLRKGFNEIGFKNKLTMQGSFAIKTAIKPKGANEEYDLDTLLLIDEVHEFDDTSWIIDTRDTILDYISQIGKKYEWGKFITLTIKKGIKVQFLNEHGNADFHIDIIPVFRLQKQNKTQNYIFDYTLNQPERTETILLTNLLKEQIDVNKRITLMLLKKTVQNRSLDNLDILPSIGSAVMNIIDIKIDEKFSVHRIIENLSFVIELKNKELYNPYLNEEEFFEKSGNRGKSEIYLLAVDSFRLTLEKAMKENNISIITGAIEGETDFIISPGIGGDKGGSGGHA